MNMHSSIPLTLAATLLVAAAARPQNLIFHNTLGSDAEVLSSAVGPNLTFGGLPRAYVPSPNGSAMTIPFDPQNSYYGGTAASLPTPTGLVDPERGTIEVVFQMLTEPVAYQYNPYRLFDGPFGGGAQMGLSVWQTYAGDVDLIFHMNLGGTTCYALHPSYPARLGFPMEGRVNEWLHVAATWDRAGIDGSAETMRLHLNGVLVGTSQLTSWGTAVGGAADLCGANDCCPYDKFMLDDVKIYDAAKTSFDPPFVLWFSSPAGPGSVIASNAHGTAGRIAFNPLSFDPANNGPGLGSGPFFGLHISFFDAVAQFSSLSAPFVMPLGPYGGAQFGLPPGSLASGLTFYGVGVEIDLALGTITAIAPAVAHTIP
jgi:hypothetical protein